jgi:hypothetical protein
MKSLGNQAGELARWHVDGTVVEQIIHAIVWSANELDDCYRDNETERGTGRVRALCNLLDETTKSAKTREELYRVDEELREKIRKIVPDAYELGRVLINRRRCPLSSDTDRPCATAANIAMDQNRDLLVHAVAFPNNSAMRLSYPG